MMLKCKLIFFLFSLFSPFILLLFKFYFSKKKELIDHLLPNAQGELAKKNVRRKSLNNVVLSSSNTHATILTATDSTSLLRCVAITTINNLAVCNFHIGEIFESIRMMEKYIQKNPNLFLHPSIIHNLRTCYDVAFKPTRTSSKKAVLSRLVQLYHASR